MKQKKERAMETKWYVCQDCGYDREGDYAPNYCPDCGSLHFELEIEEDGR